MELGVVELGVEEPRAEHLGAGQLGAEQLVGGVPGGGEPGGSAVGPVEVGAGEPGTAATGAPAAEPAQPPPRGVPLRRVRPAGRVGEPSPSPYAPPGWLPRPSLSPPRTDGAPESPSPPPPPPAPSPVAARQQWQQRQQWWIAVRERLPLWVQLRCGLERRTLAALAVLLVLGVVLAGRFFWTGRPETVHAPEVVVRAEPAATASADPQPPVDRQVAAPPVAAPTTVVVVDVSGKVRRPGVLRLPAGARVVDALRAAGGVPPGTDTTGLNRARVLVDGEHVLVGVPAAAGPPGTPPVADPQGVAGGAATGGPISLNSATVEQLDTLPGVGPVLARHIIDHRTRHGGFRSVEELREVRGIGARRFADLRTLVTP
ncbi:ComEA family DNA-binding protein [Streptomyces sp. DH12]|uniref:ComEA family DNA-binding protein n=1 Tax=Streptomyces sp. DH12 TaxID=2857010 RepID=UPI001E32331D|nr:ComEA family DNA-binding protein [Streptomyces sp. DH12]